MVDYHTDDDDGNRLEVDCGDTIVHFAIRNKFESEDEEQPCCPLDRDSVAALVGQLQSWLARTTVGAK